MFIGRLLQQGGGLGSVGHGEVVWIVGCVCRENVGEVSSVIECGFVCE